MLDVQKITSVGSTHPATHDLGAGSVAIFSRPAPESPSLHRFAQPERRCHRAVPDRG